MPNRSVPSTGRSMFKRALVHSATQLETRDSDQAIAFFRCVSCDQCSVLRHNLARCIGDYLSTVAPNFQAVYLFDPDSACDAFEDFHKVSSPWSALNLIVWTRTSKSRSVNALEELRHALDKARTQVLCPKATALCFALNMTVVNNAEVKARRGYVAVPHSLTTHPSQVRSRPKPSKRPVERGA